MIVLEIGRRKALMLLVVIAVICVGILASPRLLSFLFPENVNVESYVNSIGVEMISVQPASFLMGSTSGDWDEQPVHNVTITYPSNMSKTEVTVEQYREFRPDCQPWQSSSYVLGVSWYDAMAFCEWLSKKEGKTYRLPTEAEWEYACQHAEAFGLRNMDSGVLEWCLDWYGPYSDSDQTDPVGPETGYAKVARGGSIQDATSYYRRPTNRASLAPRCNVDHPIGFRIVEALVPQTEPLPYEPPFVQQCVKQTADHVLQAPDPNQPYFRRRYLLPIPPEDVPSEDIWAAGLPNGIASHNHCPAMVVCSNGDVLAIYYTTAEAKGTSEQSPTVALIATRLRFGSGEWDTPQLMFDMADLNDHAPLLWNDNDTLHLFWGQGEGTFLGVPFKWTSSTDSGATWTEIRFPVLREPVGGFDSQPVNTAFRDKNGRMHVACDGNGDSSLLWASDDDGETWFDTGGRIYGRHGSFVSLDNGSVLAFGRNVDIDGYMPQSLSNDGGKTWIVSKSAFPALRTNQRPAVIRIASGRLLYAGDFQDINGDQPPAIAEQGSFVALSADGGKTWHIKKLPSDPHESRDINTIGYVVLEQASNGVIHLITSMNHPAVHFEFNEAWILSPDDATFEENTEGEVMTLQENYTSGKVRVTYSAKICKDGRYLLHGTETWYYENGNKQWEVTYCDGVKVGQETYWASDGTKKWEWYHYENGTNVWTQYWPDGIKKAESSWCNNRCEGIATRWDKTGKVISRVRFENGTIAS